jgi:flagellar biosynthesis protein FlhF
MATPALNVFRASTFAEAIAMVKRDLGPDAMIVHTRTIKTGGVMGLGGTAMVEITASATSSSTRPVNAREVASRTALVAGVPTRRHGLGTDATSASRPADASRRSITAAKPDLTAARMSPAASDGTAISDSDTTRESSGGSERESGAGRRSLATRVRLTPATAEDLADLRSDLDSIKAMVTQLTRVSRACASAIATSPAAGGANPVNAVLSAGSLPGALFAQYARMLDSHLSAEIAQTVIARVREELPAERWDDARAVRGATVALLASMIEAVPFDRAVGGAVSVAARTPDRSSRMRVVALIGPTGVGKTTTIAKLAAAASLRQGRSVTLLTTDTYRIAAVDQLRTYAEILGIEFAVASTCEEASRIRRACRSNVLLVDTPGRAPADRGRIEELREILGGVEPHDRLLVISASSSESSMSRVLDGFADCSPSALIFTKLDEAGHLGPMVNVARRSRLAVSHVTTGQDVPDFIAPASSEALARSVLDGEWPIGGAEERTPASERRETMRPTSASSASPIGRGVRATEVIS